MRSVSSPTSYPLRKLQLMSWFGLRDIIAVLLFSLELFKNY